MEHLPLWIVFGGYATYTLALASGWWLATWRSRRISKQAIPAATVLIPFRSEATRFAPLIGSIKKMIGRQPDWEFLFINDHSEDESMLLLQNEFKEFSQVRILELPYGQTGKKSGIKLGVAASIHPFIITTDADSEFSSEAMERLASALATDPVQMVCGPVLQNSRNVFAGFADLEFLSLIGSSAAFWGWGIPIMGNGAFLGFRKEAFKAVDGFGGNEQFPGGDDVFLLQKIHEKFGAGSIHFLTHAQDVVQTSGDGSWREFVHRRVRWGAKAKAYQTGSARAVTFITLLVQSAVVVCVLGLLLSGQWHLLLCSLILKAMCDTLLLVPMVLRFRRWHLLPYILPASPLHPFYLFFTACLSLRGRYEWKKRTYRP